MKITKQGVTAALALWLVLAALTQSLAQSFGPPLPADLQPISSIDSLPDSAVFYGISDFPEMPPLPLGVALYHPDTPLYWSPSANAVFADDREETIARLLLHAAQDSGLPGFGDGGDGGDDGGGGGGSQITGGIPIDTNGLWLEITSADLSLAYLNLHHPTNQVYAILSTTNLLSTWQIETELWPTNQDLMPFTVPTLDRQALFLQAEDWTTVDSDGDGIPDWWIWLYFGNLNESATNLDTQGNTLLYDYTNSLDPNVIAFTLSATNSYANQTAVTLQVALLAGTPSYYAVLVNDPNPQDANWLPYTGTNLTANLGPSDGTYQVSVALRGLPQFAQQTWQTVQLTLDTVAPTVVITNPTVSVTTQPTVQLQGYTTKPLSAVRYDISNAAGVVTNQTGFVRAEYFDPVLFAFTTNWFQCYDLNLTNGVNTITLRVTDWAGNTTTTNFNVNLDYSTATNPVVQVIWPPDGSQICAGTFTCRGTLDDPTAAVTAQITDTNGNVTALIGLVERNGNFWLENLPLTGGPNTLAIAVTNAAGLGTLTTLTLTQGSITLAMDPVPPEQLWQPTLNVSGTVSDTGCTLSVNGVDAVNNGDGTWYALRVPSSPGGVASFDLVAQSQETTQNSSGLSRLASLQADAQAGGATPVNNTNLDKPAQIIVTSYVNNWTNTFTPASGNGSGRQPLIVGVAAHSEKFGLLWQEDVGTTAYDTAVFGPSESCTTNFTWPADEYILNVRMPSSNGVASDTCSMSTNQVGSPTILLEHCALTTNGVVFGGTNSYSRTAQAVLTLVTGGKAQLNQQRLFQISGSVLAITNPATLAGYGMPPSQIRMGELGFLGTDGNLWCALQDNDTKTITPRVLGTLSPDYYTFTASETKYKLTISANGNDLSATNPEFCVGQNVTFTPAWDSQPGYDSLSVGWVLPPSFVNEPVPSVSPAFYDVNDDLLTNLTTSCWYVDGPGGAAIILEVLHFPNGQYVPIAALGHFSVYRPTIPKWDQPYLGTPTAMLWSGNLGVGNAPAGSNIMSFQAYIQSKYPGMAGFTQLISGFFANDTILSLDGYELDNTEWYRGQKAVQGGGAASRNPVPFDDGPYLSLSIFHSDTEMDLNYKSYLRFRPDVGVSNQNIFVTLQLATWSVSATATNSSGWLVDTNSLVDGPDRSDSSDFPIWTNTFSNH